MKPLRIYPISEQALTIAFSVLISEAASLQVLQLHQRLQSAPFPGFIESVPSYGSLTVYFSDAIKSQEVRALLNEYCEADTTPQVGEVRQHLIPVCYAPEYGADLQEVSELTQLSIPEIVQLHTSLTFRVYMIGFVPGFAYMGILPPELETPRRKTPRLEVPEGSVAIAGLQTGIYPARLPGGWNIIGKTPWQLFDKNTDPCSRLAAGDLVRFESITPETFEALS